MKHAWFYIAPLQIKIIFVLDIISASADALLNTGDAKRMSSMNNTAQKYEKSCTRF
jgi:hypothetical protein